MIKDSHRDGKREKTGGACLHLTVEADNRMCLLYFSLD